MGVFSTAPRAHNGRIWANTVNGRIWAHMGAWVAISALNASMGAWVDMRTVEHSTRSKLAHAEKPGVAESAG